MKLNAIRIVLVGTSHPGNIGAAARAMKTMGLSQLWLVAPERFPDPEASARAAGADDVLAQAQCVATLEQALVGCARVAGTTARLRHLSVPVVDPRTAAANLYQTVNTSDDHTAEVALVFGRERTGLTNSEIDLCHLLVQIPSNPDYSSLNLGAAVQVLSYELRMAALAESAPAPEAHLPAPAEEQERFYTHLEQVLLQTGFLDPANPRLLMRRLRRLFARACPDQNEINILRGVLTSFQRPKRR